MTMLTNRLVSIWDRFRADGAVFWLEPRLSGAENHYPRFRCQGQGHAASLPVCSCYGKYIIEALYGLIN